MLQSWTTLRNFDCPTFERYLGVTYFIRLIGQAGLDSTDDQIDGTKKLFESYEELLIVSYSNSQRKKFVVFVDS